MTFLAGLTHAKKCVNEMAVFPLRHPDLFMGCRSPGRGLLLFGPPVSANFSYRYYKFQRPALSSVLYTSNVRELVKQ